ncbi:hypothetical protein NP493_2656g00002 [Ridgeia piscesae]|uniref:Laminin EGF-like domain-containing protein n=1 Tax=Ridgeia piscesae TaxID=27915 RepID=A0AAD9JDQ7_RIDPI|nr:hypothetical protein NP493_2656g00002 [Ridgeia piscesae]
MDDSSGVPINNVEHCVCPPQYTGLSCDGCSPGHTRVIPNGGPFVECVPCDCNGHAATPCDPDTGACNCTHNAAGDHCEVCLTGFYGNPTVGTPDDCQPCMCPGNVVASEVNVFASECVLTPGGMVECVNCSDGHSGGQCDVCVEGWYGTPRNASNAGGQCLLCQCHGRADTCDTVTGVCVDCRNDTAGKECDICAPTYFGDAASYSCQLRCGFGEGARSLWLPRTSAFVGLSAGATGQCDDRTGQCHCKPNVQSFLCTECAPNSYNYSSGEGCYPCDCHGMGAYGQRCHLETGQCLCRPHTLGRRCDYCEATYWQVDSISGCKQAYQFVQGVQLGVYPNCQLCGACYDTWAVKIEEEGRLLWDLSLSVLQLWARYDNMTYATVRPLLVDVQTNLTNVDLAILLVQDIVADVKFLQQGFDKISGRVGEYKAIHLNMTRHVKKLREILSDLTSYRGNVAVSETEQMSPEQFIRDTAAMATFHSDLYSRANSSWTSIRNLTMAIKTANGTVEGLVSQMKVSIAVIDEAKLISKYALSSINPTIGTRFHNNTRRLKRLKTIVGELTGTLVEVTEQVARAADLSQQANTSVTLSYKNVAVNGESCTRDGHPSIHRKVQCIAGTEGSTDCSECGRIESAMTIKQAMTTTLEDTVGGLVTLSSVNEQLIAVNELTANVSRISLPQLEDMKTICKAINATSISDAAVKATLTKAKEGLATAEETLNMTKLASEAAHIALEEVREIQYNLGEAEEAQREVYTQREAVDAFNRTYTAAIEQVLTKGNDAIRLAEMTNTSISTITALVGETMDCFQEATNDTTLAEILTEKALQLVKNAANQNLTDIEQITDLECKYF